MIKVATIGYPRIGPKRELKVALEKFWKGDITESELQNVAIDLRKKNWQTQKDNTGVLSGLPTNAHHKCCTFDPTLNEIDCTMQTAPNSHSLQKRG